MRRIETRLDASRFPLPVRPYIEAARAYDSSCSPEARVYFLDTGAGYYLKEGKSGTLLRESLMDGYFHSLGLGPRVVHYSSDKVDHLLTERVPGEDCTNEEYLSDGWRLATLLGRLLRELHSLPTAGCPVTGRMEGYLATVDEGYRTGRFDPSFLRHGVGSDAESVYRFISGNRQSFKNEVLIHGDFCLPNIMLDGWRHTGYIDLGAGGVGDRHVDLFWGVWTLGYNLGTAEYGDALLDAYGRGSFDPFMLDLVSAAEAFG